MVSRKHAEIVFHDAQYWVRDLGGINGTFLDANLLPQHVDCPLRPGSTVSLGSSSFVFQWRCPEPYEWDAGRVSPSTQVHEQRSPRML